MAELTLEDAAKILNEHDYLFEDDESEEANAWVVGREGLWVWNGGVIIMPFEARAIAREYLRLDGKLPGPATRAVMAWLAKGVGDSSDRQRIGLPNRSFIDAGQIRAFIAEQEAEQQP